MIIPFDKNRLEAKEKTNENIEWKDYILVDDHGKIVADQERQRIVETINSCIESYYMSPDALIKFTADIVNEFLTKCSDKVGVKIFDANDGKELFEQLQDVKSFYIICVVEGEENSTLMDILMLDKPFLSDIPIAVKICNTLPKAYRVTAFYSL